MGSITVEQIVTFILGLAAFIGACSAIVAVIIKLYGKTVGKSIASSIKPIHDEITNFKSELEQRMDAHNTEVKSLIDNLDTGECRNFLVRFLGDIERGVDIDSVEIQRAYEVMQHYSEDLKQNSYIHDRWTSVMGNRSLAASLKKYSKK